MQQQVQGEVKSTAVGNKNQRENHELSLINVGADPIKSHYDLGLVQTEPYGGMESHLSSNSQEQEKGVPALNRLGLAGMGKPLVAIPNGHSIKGGRKNLGVESIVSKFAGANFAKIKPSGGITIKENGRNTDLCNKFDGVFGSHHSSPNVWGKHSIQSPHNVQGSTDGDNGACNMFVETEGLAKTNMRNLSWKLLNQARNQLQVTKDPVTFLPVLMNIICWNCRGALNPRFKLTLNNLISKHNPSMVIITKTRVGGNRAKEITNTLPFDGAIHTDTIGYAGGLWLLWKSEEVEVTQLAKTEHKIHIVIKVLSSDLSWILTCIYASLRFVERKLLWGNLSNVALLHNLPWVMLGDFNELLSNDDKSGGNPVNMSRALLFKDCLDSCGMIDLGFHGARYTWVNK